MVSKILCVAEKPSIAKAVANHLGGTVVRAIRAPGDTSWLYNYEFEFTFSPPWGHCQVVMTCVAGHLMSSDFEGRYRSWHGCAPAALFDARIVDYIEDSKKSVAKNIETQARGARGLFIWTDCDREGEHIGSEIRDVALKVNGRLDVKRARFSNIERAHVLHAAKTPVLLDQRQAQAVSARMELDLRLGASFTRMQTLSLKPMIAHLIGDEKAPLSYGSCQFPTLGFVVDRYFRVKNFIPEIFWKIQVFHERDGIRATFNWKRVHLFDRMIVTILFERCVRSGQAKVTNLQTKPASKWRPLPLTTVELQKMGSRFLRMDSQMVMKIAEELYTRGLISYPRTETDQFPQDMDLQAIIARHTNHNSWGTYAQSLLDGAYRTPRGGRNNDQAHPPIHPVNEAPNLEKDDERRVYDFVVRRFLAACSDDARGSTTTVEITYGGEIFTASGLIVLERNYLDVYPYDRWESSKQLPAFTLNEMFTPTEAMMNEGKTTPPGYLTEPELIALMDANGIGTDATMAEHIAKIKDRNYATTRNGVAGRGGYGQDGGQEDEDDAGRGGRRGRGRGRGRGARGGANTGRGGAAAGSGGGNQEFIPTRLGVALIDGYDKVGFETSLSKPFLRKEMELQMKAICDGTKNKNDVVHESLEKYREVFVRSVQQMDVLKASFRKYILEEHD